MATKHNTEINNEPLKREYFDDVLDLFYDINEKNEELYNEIHKTFTDNQPTGFTLGASKSTVDITKTLSDLRSNSIQSATALEQVEVEDDYSDLIYARLKSINFVDLFDNYNTY